MMVKTLLGATLAVVRFRLQTSRVVLEINTSRLKGMHCTGPQALCDPRTSPLFNRCPFSKQRPSHECSRRVIRVGGGSPLAAKPIHGPTDVPPMPPIQTLSTPRPACHLLQLLSACEIEQISNSTEHRACTAALAVSASVTPVPSSASCDCRASVIVET